MAVPVKKQGLGLEMRSFAGTDGKGRKADYLVFRTSNGSYHAFVEVEAKEAARRCGDPEEGHTRQMWDEVWETK